MALDAGNFIESTRTSLVMAKVAVERDADIVTGDGVPLDGGDPGLSDSNDGGILMPLCMPCRHTERVRIGLGSDKL